MERFIIWQAFKRYRTFVKRKRGNKEGAKCRKERREGKDAPAQTKGQERDTKGGGVSKVQRKVVYSA